QEARTFLQANYPHKPAVTQKRQYSAKECMAVFVRDGFIDRYSGKRLVFPGTLRLLFNYFPAEFPYHRNWKTDSCHFAFYELYPTIDHISPITRGGPNEDRNWVTTSMKLNMAKANFTLAELGARLHPPGRISDWDGLTSWFLSRVQSELGQLLDGQLKQWHAAAKGYLPFDSASRTKCAI